jgi:hypothetical protein
MHPLIRFMVGDKTTTTTQNSVEIEASLAPARDEVGAGLRLRLTNNLDYYKYLCKSVVLGWHVFVSLFSHYICVCKVYCEH